MESIIYTIFISNLSCTANAQRPFNPDPANPNLDFSLRDFSRWGLSWWWRKKFDSVLSGAASPGSHFIVGVYGTNWEGNACTGNMKCAGWLRACSPFGRSGRQWP